MTPDGPGAGRCADGLTALHRAAGRGAVAEVRALLGGGADPLALAAGTGISALHLAAQAGVVGVGELLLAHGAFVDLQAPRNGITPLMSAVWYRHPEFAAFLLDRPEINVELRSVFGATAEGVIGFGARADDARGRRADDRMRELFARHRAARAAVLDAQPLFTTLTGTAPAGPPARERADRLRALLAAGADPDTVSPVMSSGSDGHTPLLVAARDGDTAAVADLLAAGADQGVTDRYMAAVPAHKAAYNGHADVLALLAAAPGFERVRDARGPFNGYTPLHDAVWHGHRDAVGVLLRAGARTDVRGLDGRTPLDLARAHGYPEIAAMLT